MNFENLVNVVETKISRRKMRKSERSKSNVSIPKANNTVNRGKKFSFKEPKVVESRRIRMETLKATGYAVKITTDPVIVILELTN